MKRKANDQSMSAVSAIAARRAQQNVAQTAHSSVSVEVPAIEAEPPLKRPRPSPVEDSSKITTQTAVEVVIRNPRKQAVRSQHKTTGSVEEQSTPSEKEGLDAALEEDIGLTSGTDLSDVGITTRDSYENFLLSKGSLTKNDILYKTDDTICIRLKEKTTVTILGQYDLWVKRGIVSVYGAKLSPTSQLYRLYAPSTHSLPVIKTVAGVDGYAEIEVKSCRNGLPRLRHVSDLYRRIWSGKQGLSSSKNVIFGPRMSFSILHSSSDDPLKRHLRPLHLVKQWSVAIKALSGRSADLRVMTCGPKGAGKSTFNKYLLNHLLSPIPSQNSSQPPDDGVAYLDLDPGQPEFSPPGQVYLAHLRKPVLGPSFTHPTLRSPKDGSIIRSHHIGATSPKDDPGHYVLCVMDLLNRYRILLQSYPRCPLIINYPGWIFGQGLEIATWFIKTLELSDVIYMSVQGPEEVTVPLQAAANEAGVPLTTLPSQPTEFATRSSAQLRTMQTLSYFHMPQSLQANIPFWSDLPIQYHRSFSVNYSGDNPGIFGIMATGFRHDPNHLHGLLDGSVVALVALENPDLLSKSAGGATSATHATDDNHHDHHHYEPTTTHSNPDQADTTMHDADAEAPVTTTCPPAHPLITRTPSSNLPYLFIGNGTCTPLDPGSSYTLGQALVRSIDTHSQTIQLITPISPQSLRGALDLGHRIVLVRGTLDNPNWALSENYFAAKEAQKRHRLLKTQGKVDLEGGEGAAKYYVERSRRLAERVRQATKDVPWLRVVKQGAEKRREAGGGLWALKQLAPGGESDDESEQYI